MLGHGGSTHLHDGGGDGWAVFGARRSGHAFTLCELHQSKPSQNLLGSEQRHGKCGLQLAQAQRSTGACTSQRLLTAQGLVRTRRPCRGWALRSLPLQPPVTHTCPSGTFQNTQSHCLNSSSSARSSLDVIPTGRPCPPPPSPWMPDVPLSVSWSCPNK